LDFRRRTAIQLSKKEVFKMFLSRFVLSIACLVPVVALAADPPVIKKVQATPTSPTSGPEMFKQYCAACHGLDAKGHGPAVPALKVPPPDLTVLSKNNKGKFPDPRVYTAIRGDVSLDAHGSKDMPVWGTIFHDMSNGPNDMREAARLRALCLYIESLQQK
jgi:mono/diheme cytochrome c family protein